MSKFGKSMQNFEPTVKSLVEWLAGDTVDILAQHLNGANAMGIYADLSAVALRDHGVLIDTKKEGSDIAWINRVINKFEGHPVPVESEP